MSASRQRWAAIGAAVAVAVGGGTFAFVTASGGGTASAFVPIAPCRLIDTRSTSPVGPRSTPITAGESLTVQVTGSNGQCVIPASATAIVINVTAVSPTAAGYITLYPADVAVPNASNLNFVAGQNPTPNLVTVSLSPGGAIKIFNVAGNVNVLGDIAGYYQPDTPGLAMPGAPCAVGGLAGVVVNGYDHEHNVSSKCFTSLATTLAGGDISGTTDGVGGLAKFANPTGVAVDSDGNVYVADQDNNRIRKITTTGVVTTLAGSSAGFVDDTGTSAQFRRPWGIAVDSVGNVYVADTNNHAIRKITFAGVVTTLAGNGTVGNLEGMGAAARFDHPNGVAVDSAGNVYVADSSNNRIRKITPVGLVSTLAGSNTGGSADGTGAAAQFSNPFGVAVDAAGNVYVADSQNHSIRKVTADGVVTTLAGSTPGSADGVGIAAQFFNPSGIAVDSHGNVFVADFDNHRIRKVTPAGVVTTVVGSTTGFADGVGAAARFNWPAGVAVDGAGTLYVAGYDGRIRRIN